jgi:hypothetical protein
VSLDVELFAAEKRWDGSRVCVGHFERIRAAVRTLGATPAEPIFVCPATGFELWMSRVGLACANSRRAYVERLDYVAAAAADSAVSILG